MENWKKAERKSFDRLLPPERATGGLGMKCFCTNCFDTKEIVDYIDLHGELGKCTVCKSRGVKRITADQIGRVLRLYLDDDGQLLLHYKQTCFHRSASLQVFTENRNGYHCGVLFPPGSCFMLNRCPG